VITSTPPTPAYAGVTYTYQVHAVSPLNDPFSFSFDSTTPSDMSMTATGLLTWTNPVFNGNPTVVIIDVTDQDNNVSGTPQTFTLPVVPVTGSDSITLQAPPRASMLIDQKFAYLPVATDTYLCSGQPQSDSFFKGEPCWVAPPVQRGCARRIERAESPRAR
jgi:hypothetical protein